MNSFVAAVALCELSKHDRPEVERILKQVNEKYGDKMITLLNTSIITAPGRYEMQEISLNDARNWVALHKYQSAIGHEVTAQILTELLSVPVPVNRMLYQQQPGESAIVFKLRGRPEEGKILTREEVEAIGFDFFWLKREEEGIARAAL